jgi:hypothetical protein
MHSFFEDRKIFYKEDHPKIFERVFSEMINSGLRTLLEAQTAIIAIKGTIEKPTEIIFYDEDEYQIINIVRCRIH